MQMINIGNCCNPRVIGIVFQQELEDNGPA